MEANWRKREAINMSVNDETYWDSSRPPCTKRPSVGIRLRKLVQVVRVKIRYERTLQTSPQTGSCPSVLERTHYQPVADWNHQWLIHTLAKRTPEASPATLMIIARFCESPREWKFVMRLHRKKSSLHCGFKSFLTLKMLVAIWYERWGVVTCRIDWQ